MGNKNPLEDEFYNSMLYKNLNDVGGKVAEGIGKAVEEVGKAIGNSGKTGYQRPVNPPPPPGYQPPPPSSYNAPRQGQNQGGSYRYVPPQGAQNQQNNYYNGKPRPVPRPVPPPQMPKVKKPKNKYAARQFWFTVAGVALAVGLIPFGGIIKLALIVGAGIGANCLAKLIFRNWKKEQPQAVPAAAPKPAAPPPKPVEQPQSAVKKSNTGNPELDKIIDEGNEYIIKLREANVAIEDEGVSNSIDRMEAACKGIFEYVKDRPQKIPQIKKFMNYYLPTTLKLLDSYKKLSRQQVKGENISATMFDIEGMMQTIATAFEKQLDGLFGEEAMDIQADITVFESILQQEGLKDAEEEVKLK